MDTALVLEVSGANVNLLSMMTLYRTFSFGITFKNGADIAVTICTVMTTLKESYKRISM